MESSENSTARYNQRLKDLIDATSFREPDKVPVGIEVINWPLAYAGVKLMDVVDDPIATSKAYTKILDDIEIDFHTLSFGLNHSIQTLQALGSIQYRLAENGVTVEHVQAEFSFMTADEYADVISDYQGFRKNTMSQRSFKAFQGSKAEAYDAMKKAALALKNHVVTNRLISQRVAEKGIVPVNLMQTNNIAPWYYGPFNVLFDYLRGVKDSLVDLRRRPEAVKAVNQIVESFRPLSKVSPDDYPAISPIPASWTFYHSECFLNNQQFDELFFQGFKKHALPYMEKGAKYLLKGEGMFLNTLGRFRELPKGSLIIELDQDDPFDAYKIIGDHQTLATGIKLDLLRSGTKQQCIDYVKRCFDTFAPGGGFIFMPQKPLIAPGDVNIKNLLAVYEFANHYGTK
ncbi:MAG: hypothetical protein LBU61_02580 [Coriobacteriales bacterium]|jgi:hypothetical protein|nr:hypothetical protein [Coriobacteriales bacterium]